jgi:hypothetical protein
MVQVTVDNPAPGEFRFLATNCTNPHDGFVPIFKAANALAYIRNFSAFLFTIPHDATLFAKSHGGIHPSKRGRSVLLSPAVKASRTSNCPPG